MRMQDPAQMTGDFLQPYRFTGKELDRVNGLNMYDFGARWYDVAGVPMWTSVDPLAEKYYHISPYAYCHNNPILYVDPDGKQVWDGIGAYCKENKDLKELVKNLAVQDDPNSIMIVAHGIYKSESDRYASYIDIQAYNSNTGKWDHNEISNGKQLDDFLSANSQTWKDYKNGNISADDLHIVFYACGSSHVVQEISKDTSFKDVTFIAPDKKLQRLQERNGSWITTVEDTKWKKSEDGNTIIPVDGRRLWGDWQTYKNGKVPIMPSTYSGKKGLLPGTKGFDYRWAWF